MANPTIVTPSALDGTELAHDATFPDLTWEMSDDWGLGTPFLRVRRSSDNQYWNFTSGEWQAASVYRTFVLGLPLPDLISIDTGDGVRTGSTSGGPNYEEGVHYVLYTEEDTHTRFVGIDPDASDNLVAVKWNTDDLQWEYDTGSTMVPFTPVASDVIIGEFVVSGGLITGNITRSLLSYSILHGIRRGAQFLSDFQANYWEGGGNTGDFLMIPPPTGYMRPPANYGTSHTYLLSEHVTTETLPTLEPEETYIVDYGANDMEGGSTETVVTFSVAAAPLTAGTSTVADCRASLFASLQNHAPLDNVHVTYGDPGEDTRRESIRLGSTVTGSQRTSGHQLTPRKREEDYEFPLYVEAISTSTPQAAEARAFELGAEVEQVIAHLPLLDGQTSGLLWVQVTDFEMETTEVGGIGPRTVITYTITAKGRLQ